MSESKRNIPSNFQSEEEAFEYLIQKSQDKALKDQWKMELDQLPDAPEETNGTPRKVIYRRIMAIAASFVILLGSFYWFTNQDPTLQQMADAMITDTNFVLESGSFTRGVNDEVIDEFEIALQKEINTALEKEDYSAAIGLFLTKEKKSQLLTDDKFYFALSLARVDGSDYHKAIRLLEDVISRKESNYSEALWLQALLYIKIEEPLKSKIILNKLINNTNYQITHTKALLERMAY